MSAPTTVGPWRVQIPATTTEHQDSKPFTVYVISIHYTVPAPLRNALASGETTVIDWTVNRRYSEFETLRSKLVQYSSNVPPLPGKTLWGSLSADTVATRKVGLANFLNQSLASGWILEMECFREFLRIDEQVPARLMVRWRPIEIKCVGGAGPGVAASAIAGSSATLGVTDLVYLPEQLVLMTGMEEQRLLAKADNIVSQIKLFQSKSTPTRPLPLGAIKIHRVDELGSWRVVCSVDTVSGVSCMNWNNEQRNLICGADDGTVSLYKVSPDFLDLELRRCWNIHAARVAAMCWYKKRSVLLTAGRDRELVVFDPVKEVAMSSTTVGAAVSASAWVSSLQVDEAEERAFVGTYATFIHIYDISTPSFPRLLHTLQGHTGSVRCLQYRPIERYLFSGGFDHWAGVWTIGPGDAGVLRSRCVGWLKEGAPQKIKSIVFIPPLATVGDSAGSDVALVGTNGLVVTGHDDGFISFFDIATGRMRYSVRAHTNSVVQLRYLEEPRVLLTSSLDGSVKFLSIPSATGSATANVSAQHARDARSDSEAAAAAAAVAALSLVPSTTSSSSSSSSEVGPRKSSSFGPSAPPPSMASGGSVLRKSSRADDVTLFSTSYADANESPVKDTRTAFFQSDEVPDIPEHRARTKSTDASASTASATSVPSSSSSTNVPSTAMPSVAEEATSNEVETESETQSEQQQAGEGVEVAQPQANTGEQEENDMF